LGKCGGVRFACACRQNTWMISNGFSRFKSIGNNFHSLFPYVTKVTPTQ